MAGRSTKPPALDWLSCRAAGVLLHPTSLQGDQGIGVLGSAAYEFVDFLKSANLGYWQVLPLGITGYGDSPYQSFSAFAGNPYLIDLQPLLEAGLLEWKDLEPLRNLPRDHVDYSALYRIKWPVLRLAYRNFSTQKRAYLPNYGYFDEFCAAEASWLEPYSAFMALKEQFGHVFWGEWPAECRTPASARASRWWDASAAGRRFHSFVQYLFFAQWSALRAYARQAGVAMIGDAPIFVALDSADVWSSPELFEMSSPAKPDFVAGVPPDYFSATGQLWGNPLYHWRAHQASGYRWWIERLQANFKLFDVVRLDHFRGFYDYWRIPADAADARSGSWANGPKRGFFDAVARAIPDARIIAEDLGELHDGVFEFRRSLGLPGMAILQFAFDGSSDNTYLPHNLTRNCVVYPGSHDNDTSRGWYEGLSADLQDYVRRYLRVNGHDIAWDLIRAAYASVARLAMIPMQDLMDLPTEGRMNVPGCPSGNWQWRMTDAAFQQQRGCAGYLRELARLYGRCE